MSDIVERLRTCPWDEDIKEAADEIERLRAEVETWVDKARTAVWSDSEECRLLAADNERLRAALHGICMFQNLDEDGKTMQDIARAALETPTASAAENTDDR